MCISIQQVKQFFEIDSTGYWIVTGTVIELEFPLVSVAVSCTPVLKVTSVETGPEVELKYDELAPNVAVSVLLPGAKVLVVKVA